MITLRLIKQRDGFLCILENIEPVLFKFDSIFILLFNWYLTIFTLLYYVFSAFLQIFQRAAGTVALSTFYVTHKDLFISCCEPGDASLYTPARSFNFFRPGPEDTLRVRTIPTAFARAATTSKNTPCKEQK
jgi:hypothetical protein